MLKSRSTKYNKSSRFFQQILYQRFPVTCAINKLSYLDKYKAEELTSEIYRHWLSTNEYK